LLREGGEIRRGAKLLLDTCWRAVTLDEERKMHYPRDIGGIRDRKGGESNFYLDLIKGGIAQVIVRTILERFGYEVYPYGFENYFSSITRSVPKPSASIPAKQIRATPDLLVFDRKNNKVFFVEVKGTSGKDERRFSLRMDKLDDYRSYWEEAILVIYCFRSGKVYCEKISQINYDEAGTRARDNKLVSVLNLKRDFRDLPSQFQLIEAEKYQEFCGEIRGVVKQFGMM
jgi:hypothetical protein